jgi:thymidylate kinase
MPELQVWAECPNPPVHTAPEADESFPDDDAWADNRDLSLASLIDRTHLTDQQFLEALQLLEENRDVFCFHPSELGTCTMGSHTIDTGEAAPIKKPYYRMPFKKYEQLREHVDRLLENGIIRPSNSAWAAPMHLVPKKGDATREVVDYRALNAVTKADAFPIPRIDDILYNIGPADTFSVLDCFSGYLQIKVDGAPDDPADTAAASPSVQRTAFSVPWGHYEYLRMPFGLQGGPATFMRIQQEVLDGLVGKKAFVFFDDTITYSTGFDSHKENLVEIFGRLRKANLKLNPVKCQFFKSHVTFLGFVVDEKGLSPDPRLIEAIANRQEPHSAKAVASFLGLTGYYRRFVKDYSKIAEPLTRLLSPKLKFHWGPEQQQAFETLRDKLTTYPILRRPDFSKPFILHTDASGHTIGAILAQKDEDGKEHAVAYHSKKLTPTERNWPITHLECFAVVNAVCEHFADFLLGHPFTVYTDCSALQWLLKSQRLQGKLARWSLRLQEFMPFDIQYRKGSQHQAADAMTRHADANPADDGHSPDPPEQFLTMTEPTAGPSTNRPAGKGMTNAAGAPSTQGSTPSQQEAPSADLDEAMRTAVRICIEGNIGCGKSSVLEALREHQATDPNWESYTLIPEPVHEWHHLLGPLYAAPPNTALRHSTAALLQVAVLNAYALRVPSPVFAPTVITERSAWSSLTVFLPVQGLPPPYKQVVTQTAHHMYPNLDNALPTAIIYLRTDPTTCLDRIQQRQRHGEQQLTLDYLSKIHQQYEQEVALFPGPVITIDASKPKSAVLAAVKSAIDLLMGAGTLSPQRPLGAYRRLAAVPYLVQDFPMLRQLFPDRKMTTCDPYLLHLFPEQLLTHEEISLDSETDLLVSQNPGTPPQTLSPSATGVPYKPHAYKPTHLDQLYDSSSEVLVMYQNGPGTFAFSTQFCTEYSNRHGAPADCSHRVDNTRALQLFAEMGPWLANGPSANIQLAAVPRKAQPAIRVLQVHPDGTEVVFVDTTAYATVREVSRDLEDLLSSSKPRWGDSFPLQDAYRNEAYTLDGWVRLVRLRPMLPCGLSLHSSRPATLLHSATPPSDCEYTTHSPASHLRLAGGVPHHDTGLTDAPPSLDQLNTLQETPRRSTRTSAHKALQQIHSWTNAQAQAVTGNNEVPSDLPCDCCGSPHDWTSMLICSKCDRGFHTYCIGLTDVPEGDDWFCHDCLAPKQARAASPALPVPTPFTSSPEPGQSPAEGSPSPSKTDPAGLQDPSGSLFDLDAELGREHQGDDLEANIPDLWQTAAEDEEAEDNEESTPLLEIWEDKATLTFLKDGQYDVDLLPDNRADMSKAMKRISKRATAFYWNHQGNTLHKHATPRYPNDREVPRPDQRDKLIDDMHKELGHVGVNKLCSAILARYYWMGVFAAVKRRLQQCQNCLRTKVLFKQQPQLRPLPPSEIWERVAMDSMGPYPPTKKNNRFILIAVDACSKWVEARAVPELTSAAMASFFQEEVVCRHGTPTLCCTDNGREFQKDFKAMLQSLGVAHNYSAAYHPESNGQAEAAVKSTLHGLQRTVGDNPFNWDEQLSTVLLGMRSTKHASTGYSPHYVLTGRHPVLPTDRRRQTLLRPPAATSEGPSLPATEIATADSAGAAPGPAAEAATRAAEAAEESPSMPPTLDAGTQALLKKRKAQQQEVKQDMLSNIQRAQQKQKKDFVQRHHSCPDPAQVMPEGSFVLLKAPATSKLHHCKAVEGPYRLVQYVDGNTRAIIQEAGGKRWPVATSRLAPFEEQ